MGVDEDRGERKRMREREDRFTMTLISGGGSEATERRKAVPRSNGTQTTGTDSRTRWCDEAATLC